MANVRFGKFIPQQVLSSYGLQTKVTVERLIEEAKKFDTKNTGYLSQDEFVKAAEALKKSVGKDTTSSSKGFRYALGQVQSVRQEYLTGNPTKQFTNAQLVDAAKVHDNGDKYLSRKELEAGAIDLQLGRDAGTLSNKLVELFEAKKFPRALSKAPATTGLREFEVTGLTASAPFDDLEGQAFLDEDKRRVFVKLTQTENLPWEGATSTNVRWFSIPLSKLD